MTSISDLDYTVPVLVAPAGTVPVIIGREFLPLVVMMAVFVQLDAFVPTSRHSREMMETMREEISGAGFVSWFMIHARDLTIEIPV